jgi:hypothetical protein
MKICVEVFSKTKATHTTRDIPIASFMHALLPAPGRMKTRGQSAEILTKTYLVWLLSFVKRLLTLTFGAT